MMASSSARRASQRSVLEVAEASSATVLASAGVERNLLVKLENLEGLLGLGYAQPHMGLTREAMWEYTSAVLTVLCKS